MYQETEPSRFKLLTHHARPLDIYAVNSLKKEHKLIKEVVEECVIDPSVMVKDMSLLVSGPEEDKAFLGDPHLWLNVRRGNTLLEFYDPEDYSKLQKVVYARKGMNKFFDVKLEFVQASTRYREDELDDLNYDLKWSILGPVKKALLSGHSVEIVKALKANGENVQVSFN